MGETYWSLLRSGPHWAMELTVTLLFDGVLLGVVWPFIRRHWGHHVERDRRDGIGVTRKGNVYVMPKRSA